MKQDRSAALSIAILGVLLLGACASPQDTAIFVTKTSFSLVDVDTAPASISIAYDRVEGYIGPRFDDGKVFPVISWLETSGEGFSRNINQVYATGKAARIVTTQGVWTDTDPVVKPDGQENKVVLFGTNVTVGLKIGYVQGTPVPTSFTIGYRRKEASLIPVDRERQPSVLASFDNGVAIQAAGGRPEAGFGVAQYFATGLAAENLAMKDGIRQRFRDKAEEALGNVERYRNEEARQGRMALDTLSCFSKVSDDRLDQVWNNADALGVFGEFGTVDRIKKASGKPDQQRQIYTGEIGLLDASSPKHTTLLELHMQAVCKLSKPKA